MTATYKYTLDKSSKKYRCPQCGKKTFVLYVDSEGNFAPEEFGRCDRQDNCGYLLYPTSEGNETLTAHTPQPRKPQIYFPTDIANRTTEHRNISTFYTNLKRLGVPEDKLQTTFKDYRIGALNKGKYAGSVTFPYIDKFQRVHSVQVKAFDENNKTTDQNWLHSILYYHYKPTGKIPQWLADYHSNEKKTNCLFGEHLLNQYSNKEIIIAESPKNAILGSFYLPEYLWLASGSLSTLSVEKLRKLKGRKILLIPDTSKDNVAFDKWELIAQEANDAGIDVKMLTFLEEITTEEQKAQGYDIADYIMDLLKSDPNLFKTEEPTSPKATAKKEYSEIERVKVGMTFDTAKLTQLAKKMIPENDSRTQREMTNLLFQLEGLKGTDASDLLMVMRLKNIIDLTNQNQYFLFNSTPF